MERNRSMERSSPGFRSWGQKFLENMLSAVYLLTYKKVTFNNGVSFMQTNISVSFTVISEWVCLKSEIHEIQSLSRNPLSD